MKSTLSKISKSFDLPVATMERWIRQGRIPVQKNGKECIYRKSVLNKWARAHNLTVTSFEENSMKGKETELENLLQVMKRGGVLNHLKGNTVEDVLKTALDNMPIFSIGAKEALFTKLLEREKLTSTGIGRGIAIPHPRIPLADVVIHPAITTCFFEKPIDFEAIDKRPVFVMFVLLSPSIKIHLHLLSKLSYCVRSNKFVEFLKTYPASEQLFKKIYDFERQHDIGDN